MNRKNGYRNNYPHKEPARDNMGDSLCNSDDSDADGFCDDDCDCHDYAGDDHHRAYEHNRALFRQNISLKLIQQKQ